MRYPERIVCLTEETTEILFRLGLGDRVVGISGYTVRPKIARETKPRISSFLSADYAKILALKPDLVLGFSDLQADLAAELIRRGVPVYVFNQRSVDEILTTVRLVASLVGAQAAGDTFADELERGLSALAKQKPARGMRVFFEEWHEPLISGIRWVSELIEIAGGSDVCAETRTEQGAKGRIVAPALVASRDPEVIIASWCGRKAQRQTIRERSGFAETTAVRTDQLYEIKSTYILQPGPAALTDGVAQLHSIIAAAARGELLPAPRAGDLRRAPFTPHWPD